MWLSKRKNNNFTIRETLLVDSEETPYLSLICNHIDFSVNLVLLDKNMNIVNNIAYLAEESHITKVGDKYYVFSNEKGWDFAYIYEKDFAFPKKVCFGKLDIAYVCSNDTSIYAYSVFGDEIFLFDDELKIVGRFFNPYSFSEKKAKNSNGIVLACSSDDYFCIPRFIPNSERQYIIFKSILEKSTSKGKDNDFINSCTFNEEECMLYIAMNNVIFVVNSDGIVDFLDFDDNNITSCYYDKVYRRLVVSAMNSKFKPVVFSLTDMELNKRLKGINYLDNGTYRAIILPGKRKNIGLE